MLARGKFLNKRKKQALKRLLSIF